MSEQQINQATATADAEAVETAPVEATPVATASAEAQTTDVALATEAKEAEAELVEAEPVEAEPMAQAAAEAMPEASAEPAAKSAEQPAAPADRPAADQPADPAADNGQPVVRMLSVGQQVKGIVKRITEFGAFVDIGVGRDGLVHISELSAKRVGKVSDVLQEGQEVQLWIKKLDRERNRISLTMIEPGKRTIRDLQKGEVVEGTVTRLLPYGAFIDIGIGRDALLHVREMAEGFVAKPEDVVQVGQTVEVRVIEIARRRSRVDLSMKGLRPEPEAPAQPQPRQDEQPQASEQPARPVQPERPERPARPDREQQFQQRYQQGGRSGRGDQGRGDQGRGQGRGDRRRQPEPEPEPIIELDPNDEFANIEVLTPMQLAFKRAQEKSGVELPVAKGKNDRRQDSAKQRAQQDDIMARTLSTSRK